MTRDLGRIAPDGVAVAAQDLDLVAHHVDSSADVAGVGVLRHQLQGPLLATSADHDAWTALLDRLGQAARIRDRVVLTAERHVVPAEHRPADLHRFLEPVETHLVPRVLEPERIVLDVVPGAADAENGPTLRDDVERGDDLRQQPRVAVGHAGDERAELDPLGASGQRPEQRVGLEHRLVRTAERGQLEEVVHDPDRVETGLLGGHRTVGHRLEQVGVRHAEGEVGQLQAESRHGLRLYVRGPHPAPPRHSATVASVDAGDALRAAVADVRAGRCDRSQALLRLTEHDLEAVLHGSFDAAGASRDRHGPRRLSWGSHRPGLLQCR